MTGPDIIIVLMIVIAVSFGTSGNLMIVSVLRLIDLELESCKVSQSKNNSYVRTDGKIESRYAVP